MSLSERPVVEASVVKDVSALGIAFERSVVGHQAISDPERRHNKNQRSDEKERAKCHCEAEKGCMTNLRGVQEGIT
jgi:hypothetical protein